MRLVPAVPNLSPRVVQAEKITIDGLVVKRHTHVGVSLSSYNRNRSIFERENEFVPERWMSTNGERLRLDLFKSFGDGPHRCVGMNLALLELTLVLARAFFRYDVSLASGWAVEEGIEAAGTGSPVFAFDAWAVASGRAGQIDSNCFIRRDQSD